MDDTLQLRELAHSSGTREERAQAAVRLIRALGPYRWAGLYDVTANEIEVIAWDGPGAPTYPRFPISKGLMGLRLLPSIQSSFRTLRQIRVTLRPLEAP